MLNEPAKKLGLASNNCPQIVCEDTCGDCDHKNFVFKNSLTISGRVENFLAIANSILDVHERYYQQLCEFELDICQRGELVGFSCLQCGLIDPDCITLGQPIFDLQSCAGCLCFQPVDFSNCKQFNVDLSLAPYTEIYQQIVVALEQLSGGNANGESIENFLRNFLPGARLLFFRGGAYHVSIGPASQNIMAILPLLERLAPIPLGARLIYYVGCASEDPQPFDNLNHSPSQGQIVQSFSSISACFSSRINLITMPTQVNLGGSVIELPNNSGWQIDSEDDLSMEYCYSITFDEINSAIDDVYSIDYSNVTADSGGQITNPVFSWTIGL